MPRIVLSLHVFRTVQQRNLASVFWHQTFQIGIHFYHLSSTNYFILLCHWLLSFSMGVSQDTQVGLSSRQSVLIPGDCKTVA